MMNNKTKTTAALLLLSVLLLPLWVTGCQDPVLLDALTVAVEETSDPTPLLGSASPYQFSIETVDGSGLLSFDEDIVLTFSMPMDPDSLVIGGSLAGEAETPSTASFSTEDDGENTVLTISPADHWTSGESRELTISFSSLTGKAVIDNEGSEGLSLLYTINPPEITSFEPQVQVSIPNEKVVINNDTGFTAVFNSQMDETSAVLTFEETAITSGTATLSWSSYDETQETHHLTITPVTAWPQDDGEFTFTLQAGEAGGNETETFTADYYILNGVVHVASATATGNPGSSSNPGTSTAPLSAPSDAMTMAGILFSSGGAVRVAGGTYYVNTDSQVVLQADVNLLGGWDADFDVRDPDTNITELKDGRLSGSYSTVYGTGSMDSDTIFTGFTITGGTGGTGTAIQLDSGASPLITDNIVQTPDGSDGPTRFYGIYVSSTANPTVEQNSFIRSEDSTGDFYSVYLNNGASGSIEVRNNKILIAGSGGTSNNVVGIFSSGGGGAVRNNTISLEGGGNRHGFLVYTTSTVSFENNIVQSTLADDSTGISIWSGAVLSGTVKNNVFNGLEYILTEDLAEGTDIAETDISSAETQLNTDGVPASGNIDTDPELNINLDLTPGTTTSDVYGGGLDGSSEGWGFTDDYNGTTRTGNGTTGWSIGADEYDS